MGSMISLTVLAKAEEWLTCTDMTTRQAAKALDVDPLALKVELGRARYQGVSRYSQVLSALENFGSLSAAKISEILKCSLTWAQNTIAHLIKCGEVEKIGGRTPIYRLTKST